jgi:hypothetical protein
MAASFNADKTGKIIFHTMQVTHVTQAEEEKQRKKVADITTHGLDT